MTKKTSNKKKTLTTHEKLIQSMTKEQKKQYDAEYRDLLLSEMLIAFLKNDATSVRELACAAGLSSAIIRKFHLDAKENITAQSFFKVLQELDCSLVVKKGRSSFPIEFTQM